MIYGILSSDNSRIKIGKAEKPEQRLRELQTGAPKPHKLIAVLPGSHKEEAALHREFRDLRHNGEWFDSKPQVLQYLIANSTTDFLDEPLRTLLETHPALRSLWFDACRTRSTSNGFNRDTHFIKNFKPRIQFLVGWNAGIKHSIDETYKNKRILSEEDLDKAIKSIRIFSVFENLRTQEAYSTVYHWILSLLPEN